MVRREHEWVAWLRRMVLLENQIQACLESHRARLPERIRSRYSAILGLSESRLRALISALAVRGQSADGLSVSAVRAVGRVMGFLTRFGGPRRILSMDIESVRRLERGYFEASSERPPVDISCALCGFIPALESERAGLVEDVKPFLEDRPS